MKHIPKMRPLRERRAWVRARQAARRAARTFARRLREGR